MKINITKKQYEDLLKLVYLGNWVANANRVDDVLQHFEDLESYIFSHAKEYGLEKYADTDEEDGITYPTRQFEEGTDVQKLIDEYGDENFWDELTDRLGERDFDEQYTEVEQKTMDRDERMTKLYEAIGKWDDEFVEHGVERLRVLDMTMKTKESDEK